MHCPPDQLLHRLHDGELSAADAASARAHVAGCGVCERSLAAYAAITETLRSAPLPQPAPAMLRRWATSARQRRDEAVRTFAGWLTTAAAAAIAVAVVSGRGGDGGPAPASVVSPGEIPWETTMLAAQDSEAGSEQLSDQFGAANWMAADLSAGRGEASWR